MQFKHDAHVYTFDRHDVGRVERVVLDPETRKVSHIVVRKGFLFVEDKVVPLSLIDSTTDEGVFLRADAIDLDKLPRFEETQYVSLTEEERREAAYPTGSALPMYWLYMGESWMAYDTHPSTVRAETEQNIPDNTVAVKEGARVISADGKHVGNVERVILSNQTSKATDLVIAQGLFFKEEKVIPMRMVSRVAEDEIHLSVRSEVLDGVVSRE